MPLTKEMIDLVATKYGEDDVIVKTARKILATTQEQSKPTIETGLDDLTPIEEKADKPMAKKTAAETKILDKLSELGGSQFQESSIERDGTKLRIPANMTPQRAVKTIEAFIMAEEEVTAFTRTFNYRPWDGAAATERAIRVLTGTSGIGKAQVSFFGSNPPQRITVATGVAETIEVPWGVIEVPLFDGELRLDSYRDKELGTLFVINAHAPKKFAGSINGLFNLIQTELEERSIYKGKAFNGGETPEFIDLTSVDPTTVVYSDDVVVALDTNIWAMLEHSDAMRREGVSLKRSVLLHGPYGTGKTLGGILTAQKAVANGWTFIKARPGQDNAAEVLQTARLYSPAVVFIEDVDTFARAGHDPDAMSKLLDSFDGISAKGVEILNIMTTNHKHLISKGMLRPGRLDALIEIAELDLGGVTRMVKSLVPEDQLDNIEYERVYEHMTGYLPAFVRESIDRAKLASISRGKGELLPLNTSDLCNGASMLRAQYDLMQQADDTGDAPTLDATFRGMVKESIHDVKLYDLGDERYSHELDVKG
jgi:hypothetical protein